MNTTQCKREKHPSWKYHDDSTTVLPYTICRKEGMCFIHQSSSSLTNTHTHTHTHAYLRDFATSRANGIVYVSVSAAIVKFRVQTQIRLNHFRAKLSRFNHRPMFRYYSHRRKVLDLQSPINQ